VNAGEFEDFFSRNGLIYMVIGDLSSGDGCSLGDASPLTPNGLIALVSDLHTLDSSLPGQVLPTGYSQGREGCFVTKPTASTIAVLFYFSTRETFEEELTWGREMERELRELLTSAT